MIGILYFSSTGNSLFISKKVQERFGGKIIYIPNYKGDGSEFERVIIVTPIYSFGMPTHVFDLLPKLDKNVEIIVIQNYGGMKGNADRLFYEYCEKYALNIKSIYALKMPENFTLTFTVPKFYLKSVLSRATNKINNILNMIDEKKFVLPKKGKTKEKTYITNKGNWHLIGRDFKVNENCIKCQKCISVCPVKNISLKGEKIIFGDNCVACLGCYHRCPKKAIQYKNKKKKYRYINPNINEDEIGKDL